MFFEIVLWINRIFYLLLSTFIAIDIFDNLYGSDDYDIEARNNFAIIGIFIAFSVLELLIQIFRKKCEWFKVIAVVAMGSVTSIVLIACMERYYHQLPICSRYATCARQPGSPYDESQFPKAEPWRRQ